MASCPILTLADADDLTKRYPDEIPDFLKGVLEGAYKVHMDEILECWRDHRQTYMRRAPYSKVSGSSPRRRNRGSGRK